MVVQELFPRVLDAVGFVRQSLALDHFVLELDVFQFVDQLRRVRAPDHMTRLRQGQFER